MLKFLAKYVCVALLIVFIGACSKDADVHSGKDNKQETNAVFTGLSRHSAKSTTDDSNISNQPFASVVPGYDISFPFDHKSHLEFAVEWWYLTANLTDAENNAYALQWTLFRFSSEVQNTPWANKQQYMGHVGLRDGKQTWFEERFARGGVGNVGVYTSPFNAFIDNWQWLAQSSDMFPSSLQFNIDTQVKVKLDLTADKPFVKHGEQGFSRKLKDSEQASYYYSQPHIQAIGEIDLPKGRVKVTGNAWFDHEWTSQYLSPNAMGWDWFSVHLDSGAKLMLFNMRHQQAEDYWSGTLVTKSGQTIHLAEQDIQAKVNKRENVEGHLLPLHWSIKLSNHKIDIQITPMQRDQWNPGVFSYYEGGTVISGSHSGVGFIELTGY